MVVPYEDDVHPYSDLALGRVDAVVLDAVLAERGVARNPGLVNAAGVVGVGRYVGILAPEATALRDQIDAILKQAMRDGRLEAIFRKWGLWNDDQPRLYARVLAGRRSRRTRRRSCRAGTAEPESVWAATRRYLPSLLARGAHHAAALLRVDGARRGDRRAARDRTRLRSAAAGSRR